MAHFHRNQDTFDVTTLICWFYATYGHCTKPNCRYAHCFGEGMSIAGKPESRGGIGSVAGGNLDRANALVLQQQQSAADQCPTSVLPRIQPVVTCSLAVNPAPVAIARGGPQPRPQNAGPGSWLVDRERIQGQGLAEAAPMPTAGNPLPGRPPQTSYVPPYYPTGAGSEDEETPERYTSRAPSRFVDASNHNNRARSIESARQAHRAAFDQPAPSREHASQNPILKLRRSWDSGYYSASQPSSPPRQPTPLPSRPAPSPPRDPCFMPDNPTTSWVSTLTTPSALEPLGTTGSTTRTGFLYRPCQSCSRLCTEAEAIYCAPCWKYLETPGTILPAALLRDRYTHEIREHARRFGFVGEGKAWPRNPRFGTRAVMQEWEVRVPVWRFE